MFGSRTHNQSQFERISEKTYTWRSAEQNFFYYDKEKGTRVPLQEGAKFIPLTSTNSVTGVHGLDLGRATERYNQVFSNEFTDYKDEVIRVRESDKLDGTTTVLFEGVYSPTIRDAIASVPYCKFTKNIYCLLEGEVVKLELKASSLKPWIDFEDSLRKTKTYLTDGHYVSVGKAEQRKTGSVTYYAPTFELGDITPEEDAEADRVAAEVEDKIARNRAARSGDNEAPAQVPVAPASAESPEESTEPISLDEIPF